MNRLILQPGAIPLDTDGGSIQRNTMIALGYLAQAALGTGTVVDGLAITATGPASMVVNIGQGSIFALETIDATAFGSLAVDSNPLVKIGINAEAVTAFTLTAPTTSGQSINYLIEAAFQEADGTSVVLPYYNSSNPAAPYSGPGNTGVAQNTVRAQNVQLQLKAGTAATTGTQTTPAMDSGWVGLYVITVNYGQTQITSANLTNVQLASAPFVDAQHAGRGLAPGRLLGFQKFTTAGSATYNASNGVNKVVVEVQGGGGGSGSAGATGSSTLSVCGGGGGGGFAKSVLTSGFTGGVAVTVGAGGTAGASGGSGGSGGTSSFGSLLSATGGVAGSGTTAAGYPQVAGGGGGGAGVGGNMRNSNGSAGGTGAALGTSNAYGGFGGAAGDGSGGAPAPGAGPGAAGTSPGSGASGASNPYFSNASQAGAVGAAGYVIVWEYA